MLPGVWPAYLSPQTLSIAMRRPSVGMLHSTLNVLGSAVKNKPLVFPMCPFLPSSDCRGAPGGSVRLSSFAL